MVNCAAGSKDTSSRQYELRRIINKILRYDLRNQLAAHIGEALIPAVETISQPGVIHAQQVGNGRVQVVNRSGLLGGFIAGYISGNATKQWAFGTPGLRDRQPPEVEDVVPCLFGAERQTGNTEWLRRRLGRLLSDDDLNILGLLGELECRCRGRRREGSGSRARRRCCLKLGGTPVVQQRARLVAQSPGCR